MINAGGAHLKYFALSALASSLSGISSPRMEVGAATLAGMRCNLCSWLTFVLRVLMPFATAVKWGAQWDMICEVIRACFGLVLVLPSLPTNFAL